MTPLTHAEADEMLAAYALGALAPADLQRVEEHLATCERHAQAAAELVRVTPALALTAPDREPSPELRSRILAALRSEDAAIPPPPIARLAPRPAEASPPRPRSAGSRWPARVAALAAAALLMLAGGIAIGRLTAPQPAVAQVTTWTFHGTAQGAVAHLVYFNADHRAVLEVEGLRPLAAGQVYEVWLFKGTTPIDAGIGQLRNGTLVAPLQGDLPSYAQIAMTVEPGEQSKPTSAPILVGKLSSS